MVGFFWEAWGCGGRMGNVLHAVGRRWYVMLIGLVITAGLAWGVSQVFPPNYTARGLVILIPPVEEEGANPFLSIGGLELPARVVVAALSSNAMQEQIADRAPAAEVIVSMEEATRGPVIAVDVTDSTAQDALDTLAYVTERIPETLVTLQDEVGAPDAARVSSVPLTIDTKAEADFETLIRMLVIAVGGGLVLTVLVVLVIENFSMRPTRGRIGSDSAAPSTQAPTALLEADADPNELPSALRRTPVSPVAADEARRSAKVRVVDGSRRS